MLTKIEHAKAGSPIKTNGAAWIRIVWIRGNRIGYEKTELDPQAAKVESELTDGEAIE